MSWAAIAVGVGSAVYGAVRAGAQKRKAKRELDALNANKPVETIPQEVLQSQQLAGIRANTGLPSEQYNMAMQNIKRQQMTSLRGANDRKMGLGLLATLNDNSNQAIGRLDANNAQARLQNERTLMDVNNQVANWKKGIFDRNVRQPWNRDYDYNMGVIGQANQNRENAINSGINLIGTGLLVNGGFKTGGNSKKGLDKSSYNYVSKSTLKNRYPGYIPLDERLPY